VTPSPGRPGLFLRAEILARVRIRFVLDAAAFESRVRDVAGDAAFDRLALDDLYLSSACAAGEEAAWEELESRHFGFIRDFALRCARRDPPASDVAERVIADLWQRGKIRQFAGRSSLRTWLGAVVAHAASNALESGGRMVPLEDTRPDPRPTGDGAVEDRRRLARMTAEALQALPARERLLLLYYYEQGLTLDEIGAALGGSKAAVSRRLKAIRERLRESISARAEVPPGIDFGRVDLDLSKLLSAGPLAERSAPAAVEEGT
jgi:RNA polymerase sigma-70 factor (ECF subfamily)